MKLNPKFRGGVLAFVGFMLSPLSWWNDLFVNVPLAMAFAWMISLFYRPAFAAAFVAGYWLTNVLGFVLMHKGAQSLLASGERISYSRRHLARDVTVSLLYTLIIVVLVKLKIIQPVGDYFPQK
jgi:hypothetical protein